MRLIPTMLVFLLLTIASQSEAETDQFATDEKVNGVANMVNGVAGRVEQLEAQVAALEAALAQALETLQFVRVEAGPINGLSGPHWIIEGANVHVRSGAGSTNEGCPQYSPCESVTGLGNLIVGYNESEPVYDGLLPLPVERTGSHNLVVGPTHSYSSVGGILAGYANSVTGNSSTAIAGFFNQANGFGNAVTGGAHNTTASNGESNSICGGRNNETAGHFGNTICGGRSHKTYDDVTTIVGGTRNTAVGDGSGVVGGTKNQAFGGWVFGGNNNVARGGGAVVTGGTNNVARGVFSLVAGGQNNLASGGCSVVTGGQGNEAAGENDAEWGDPPENTFEICINGATSVTGGEGNIADGTAASVSGGQNRTAPEDFNWVAGSLLEAN